MVVACKQCQGAGIDRVFLDDDPNWTDYNAHLAEHDAENQAVELPEGPPAE